MYYRHNLNYDYPSHPDEHMIKVKRKRKLTFDENYPYLDKSFGFKFMRGVYWLLVNGIVFPICRFSHGLRIYGKQNLKKHKDELKNGAITVSNHVFYWDYLCMLRAIRPRLSYFPAWKDNLEGGCGRLIRLSGGIPIPTDSMRAMAKFNSAIEEILQSGKWLHFFPEGSMWFYYPDIRPLKKAVFNYAVKYDKPILPITLSFRKRKGLSKLFFKTPCVDVHIGEPIYHDKSLNKKDAVEVLRAKTYHEMQVLNGINPWDPTYNTNQNPYTYKKTY